MKAVLRDLSDGSTTIGVLTKEWNLRNKTISLKITINILSEMKQYKTEIYLKGKR